VAAGDIRADAADITAIELMRGVGNLCIGGENDARYQPRRLIAFLLDGLTSPGAAAAPAA
jgi:hypothetical protein